MDTTQAQILSSIHDPYYHKEFRKIMDSNEKYKGHWNWWAFLFTGIWALVKGCWVLFFLIFLTSSMINIKLVDISDHVYVGFGLTALAWSLIMGWRGTWFYYVRKVKGRQPPL
jgi:hypothetical protein